MKKLIFFILFGILLNITSGFAKELPKDILESNVALLYYEFSSNEFRKIIIEGARELLEEKGYNIVAVHDVTLPYDADIAIADMECKKVKYEVLVIYKQGYFVRVSEFDGKVEQNFISSNGAFINEGAAGLEKAISKADKNLNGLRKQNLLSNTKSYDKSLADTIMFTKEALPKINLIKEQRTAIREYWNPIIQPGNDPLSKSSLPAKIEFPANLSTSKIAFVKFTKKDVPFEFRMINPKVIKQAESCQLNFEVFDTYEDYQKRKNEFDYRLLFSIEGAEYRSTNSVVSDFGYLYAIILRNEKSSEMYRCSAYDEIKKSMKEFISAAGAKK